MADSNVNYYKPGGKRTSVWPNYPLDTVLTYWDDVRVPGTQIQQFGERPPDLEEFRPGVGSYGVYTYAFDPDITEDLHFSVQLPHTYKEGTTIYPHVHWAPSTASGGNVVWGFEYVWANVFEAFPEWTTMLHTPVSEAGEVDRKQLITSFHYDADNEIYGLPARGANQPGDDKLISSMLMCRIVRWATADEPGYYDTYDADAFFLQFDIHFEVDAPGSIRPFNKVGDRSRTGRFRL